MKHLCYTKEKAGWTGFALKTFTCRGSFGGTKWGIFKNDGPSKEIVAPRDQNNRLGTC